MSKGVAFEKSLIKALKRLGVPVIPQFRAPVASIGGAGTFDGIFLTGILAVLLTSLYARPRAAPAR